MKLDIRPVEDGELEAAWRVLAELRTHLSREDFDQALARQRETHGYELIGAFEDGNLVGVLGLREVHTFARGKHLHVDDLVVSSNARGQGIGKRLIEYAERLARRRGMCQVFLDSRTGAMGFYERRGYRRHESVLVKKNLDEA
ncbi:MAG: GNAT family N-acetyltransferase [Gammaproteobacteria bacterium]